MSYSFTVRGADKAEAKRLVAEQLDQVIAQQPAHAKDREAALAAAGAFIDLVQDPGDGRALSVAVHGSVGWMNDDPEKLTGAGVGVSVSLV